MFKPRTPGLFDCETSAVLFKHCVSVPCNWIRARGKLAKLAVKQPGSHTNVKYKYGLYIDQLEASISLRPTHPSPGLSPGIWLCTRARGMENYTILILPSEGWVILTGFVLCSGRLRVGFFLFCEDRRVFKGQDFAFLSELLRRKGLPKKVSLIYLSPQTIEAENLCFRWGF